MSVQAETSSGLMSHLSRSNVAAQRGRVKVRLRVLLRHGVIASKGQGARGCSDELRGRGRTEQIVLRGVANDRGES